MPAVSNGVENLRRRPLHGIHWSHEETSWGQCTTKEKANCADNATARVRPTTGPVERIVRKQRPYEMMNSAVPCSATVSYVCGAPWTNCGPPMEGLWVV